MMMKYLIDQLLKTLEIQIFSRVKAIIITNMLTIKLQALLNKKIFKMKGKFLLEFQLRII